MSRTLLLVATLVATSVCLASASEDGASSVCDMGGSWLIPYDRGLNGKAYTAVDLTGSGQFNITFGLRHSYSTGVGDVMPDNNVTITVTASGGHTSVMQGTFASNCSAITWWQPVVGHYWCRAWTPGCTGVQPPYGQGVGFWASQGDNMVLQQGPQQAAVYGYVSGFDKSTQPQMKVTVLEEGGKSYTADAEIDTVHQPFGPGFDSVNHGNQFQFPGPFRTWKALLQPAQVGGNYTISVACMNCDLMDPMYTTANITNVTFGEVWYCSGQSNMWLPVSHSLSRNETVEGVTNGTYSHIRVMAGNSGSQGNSMFNPWMTAQTAVGDGGWPASSPLDNFGAACWYFAAGLSDQLRAAGKPLPPIGLADTAIGGQRIEEYMDNTTINKCSMRLGANMPQWDGPLWGKMVIPFVDMTVKGFLWYQGENNMGGVKGNVIANTGYGCEMADLVASWRAVWSKTPGTTDPMAPFGIVTLASSGSEGGPNMGAMRQAQTANYGVLPNPAIPNSFLAQAYDLDDPWGPGAGPCVGATWACCEGTGFWKAAPYNKTSCAGREKLCAAACHADLTPVAMGGIHPRDKKPLGDRLGRAAYNSVYGGTAAATGPTIAGCSVSGNDLTVTFNSTLLRGDTVVIQTYNMSLNMSYLEVQTDPGLFCLETVQADPSCQSNRTYHCPRECPSWAGASSATNQTAMQSWNDAQGWQALNISTASSTSITADLSPLGSTVPTAVRYAWGTNECCDKTDPMMYVTKSCGPAACPLMGSSGFPANPFIARIVNGTCECVAPQTCSG